MRYHQHDVHDVNIAVFVEVKAGIIASVPALATPMASNEHDVPDIHVTVAIEVTKEGVSFVRTDVAMSFCGTWPIIAALIGGDRAASDVRTASSVNRLTFGLQGVGLSGAAVVLQEAKVGDSVLQVTSSEEAAVRPTLQVIALGDHRAIAIGGGVASKDGVFDIDCAAVDAAAVRAGRVTREGAMADVQRAAVADATAIAGCVTGEGAIADVHRATAVHDGPTETGGCITGDGAVADIERACAEDAAAVVAAGVAVGDGEVAQRQVAAAGHVEDAECVTTAALDGGAVAVNGDIAGDGRQAIIAAVGGILHQCISAVAGQIHGGDTPAAVGDVDGADELGDVTGNVDDKRGC